MSLPLWIRLIGLCLFIIGVCLFIFSHIGLKGLKHHGYIIEKGIYSKFRNPMYLGFIIWIIGFPIYLEKRWSLFSSIIWIFHILIWKRLEEKELGVKYPEYLEYKKRTWF
ncbi:hypothetical protein JXB12_12925 [candidate division KSB1 bacterium]|nr:hypothetical protein [candidate division KSB1 bacterium]